MLLESPKKRNNGWEEMFEDVWEFSKKTSEGLTDARNLKEYKKCTARHIVD